MKTNEIIKIYSSLSIAQKARIENQLIDFLNTNLKISDTYPDICPCCHSTTARYIKKGIQSGKQRYECKECHKRFTYDTGKITSGLKISIDQFIEICVDTIRLIPIAQTADNLNLSVQTVFDNRHKFLTLLEHHLDQSDIKLSGTIEIDETYVLESSKGVTPDYRKSRHRGDSSNYRGLSHEQVCIVTATDRNGHEVFKAVGHAKPTSNSILTNFENNVESGSIIYADGEKAYNKLAKNTECEIKHLKTHKSYNKVEHINTVNQIHSKIKQTIEKYRGIATKYTNRYMALFVMIRRYMSLSDREVSDCVLALLKQIPWRCPVQQINTANIFH